MSVEHYNKKTKYAFLNEYTWRKTEEEIDGVRSAEHGKDKNNRSVNIRQGEVEEADMLYCRYTIYDDDICQYRTSGVKNLCLIVVYITIRM